MQNVTDFAGLVEFFLGIINTLIVAIFAIAFLVVIWKIIDAWIIHPDNDTKREGGKMMAITAVIVMVIMVSIWGILELLQRGIFGS